MIAGEASTEARIGVGTLPRRNTRSWCPRPPPSGALAEAPWFCLAVSGAWSGTRERLMRRKQSIQLKWKGFAASPAGGLGAGTNPRA